MSEEELTVGIQKGMELGKIFAESGIFPDVKTASQGYVKILAGRELNMTPMQSLNAFYFIAGKIGITSNAVASLVKTSKKYDYSVKTNTESECTLVFYKGEEVLGESTFTFKDAAKAGLVNKDVWKNYPRNMLFARALMNGVRWYCPDAISGGMYSVEELDDLTPAKINKVVTITEDGEVRNDEELKETV